MNITSLLIVCIGNICRSPIAEELFRLSLPNVTVTSSGISAVVGSHAHDYSIAVMQQNGFDLSKHIARQISVDIVKEADLILVMTTRQQDTVEKMFPFTKGRVMRLGHWNNCDIDDPNGMTRAVFENTFVEIHECVNTWIQRLKK